MYASPAISHFLQKGLEYLTDAILFTDVQGNLLYINPAFRKTLGYTAKELQEAGGMKVLYDKPEQFRLLQEAIRLEGEWQGEVKLRKSYGTGGIFLLQATLVQDDAGSNIGMMCTYRDITDEKIIRQEKDVTEDQFRSVFESAFQFICLLDQEGKVLEANRSALQLGSFSSSEVVGRYLWLTPWWEHAPESQHAIKQAIRQAANGNTVRFEVNLVGSILDFSLRPVKSASGEISSLVAEGHDITEVRGAEMKAIESESKFREMSENVFGVIYQFIASPKGWRMKYFSPRSMDIFGVSDEAVVKDMRNLMDLIHPDDAAACFDSIQKCVDTLSPWNHEARLITPDGKLKWWQGISKPIRISEEEVLFNGVLLDITERKKSEEILQMSERRFRSLNECSPSGIFMVTNEGFCTWTNSLLQSIAGFSFAEALGDGWFERVHPDDLEQVSKTWEQYIAKPGRFSAEYRYLWKDGTIRWVHTQATPIRIDQSQLIGHVGMVEDITERKRTEDELRISQNNLLALVENTEDCIWSVDVHYQLITCNSAIRVKSPFLFGLTWQAGDNVLDMTQPQYRGCWESLYRRAFAGERFQVEQQYQIGGEEKEHRQFFELSFNPITDDRELISGVTVFLRNSTENKRFQEKIIELNESLERKIEQRTHELAESEQKFRMVYEQSPLGIALTDANGAIVQANAAFSDMLGYDGNELLSRTLSDITCPEDVESKPLEMGKSRQGITYEKCFIAKRGNPIWVNLATADIHTNQETIVNGLTLVENITDKKLAQAELSRKDQLYRTVIATSLDGYLMLGKTGNILEANDTYCQMVGYDRGELLRMHILDIDLYLLKNLMTKELKEAFQIGYGKCESVQRRKDNTLFNIEASISYTDDNGGFLNCFIRNITERKQAELALVESKIFLDKIINIVVDPIFVKDSAHKWVVVNNAFCTLTGYRREDLIGRSDYDFFPKQEADLFWHNDDIIFRTGKEVIAEEELSSGDGLVKSIITKKTLYTDRSGKKFIVANFADITERKKHELKLRQSEAALTEAQQLARMGNWKYQIDTKEISWSKEMYTILGLDMPEGEYDYEKAKSVIYPNDFRAFQKAAAKLFHGEILDYTCVFRVNKNDEVRYLKNICRMSSDDTGKNTALIGVTIDITDSTVIEQKLRESEEKYRLISENMNDLVCLHDRQGRFTYVSPSVIDFLGYRPDELIGLHTCDIIHPEDVDRVQEETCFTSNREKRKVSTQFRLLKKFGDYVWVETISNPIYDGDKFVVLQSATRDISESKRAEEEIFKALMKEKELNELKSRFVSMASHEFRTPLTGIQSSSEIVELILKSPSNTVETIQQNTKKYFHRIRQDVSRMTALMDDILTMGTIEAGKIEFRPEETNLAELITQMLDQSFSSSPDGRTIKCTIEGQAKLVKLDGNLIGHVLRNLISNAFKYSVGQPEPELLLVFSEKNVRIEVKDYGIGIPLDEQRNLFQSFFRAKNTVSIQGTGLGLVIVKQFIELHGGDIQVESKPDEGSCFSVILPIVHN